MSISDPTPENLRGAASSFKAAYDAESATPHHIEVLLKGAAERIEALEAVAEAAVAARYMLGVDITSEQSYIDRDNYDKALQAAGYNNGENE